MSFPEFGEIIKESPQGFQEFGEVVEEPSRARSLASAPLKGLIRGASKFSPLPSFGPIPGKMKENLLEQFLPTQKGHAAEDILEFTGENVPFAALGQGGLVKKGVQSLAGALGKKAAKEAQLPEWAQEIIGAGGMAAAEAPQAILSKTIRPSSKQAATVDFLKNKGFGDREITPLIQDKKKLSMLSKPALKFEREDPFLRGIKDKLGNIYESIREKGNTEHYLEKEALRTFENKFYEKFNKIHFDFKDLLKKNIDHLFDNPINFSSLHDFVEAVNRKIGDIEGGKAVLGILKEPVRNAQKELNPSLYKELRDTDALYGKFHKYLDKMTKRDSNTILKWGPELGSAALGAITFNPLLFKAAGLIAASRLTTKQLLSNPRLQNIHLKMMDAIKKNDTGQALKLLKLLEEESEDQSEDSVSSRS